MRRPVRSKLDLLLAAAAVVAVSVAGCGKPPEKVSDGHAAAPQASATTSEPVSLDGLDRSCATDADCKIVDEWPCAKPGCRCPDKSIAAKDVATFAARAKAVTCGKPDTRICSECRRNVAICDHGTCGSKPQ